MKTHSELKVFKSNGYNYIYIYYKLKNRMLRINTKLLYIEGGMTKDLYFKNIIPDYEFKNNYIQRLKSKVDYYISGQLLNPLGLGIHMLSQKECYELCFGEPLGNKFLKEFILLEKFDEYLKGLDKEHDYKQSTIKYYNNLKNCLKEFGKEKGVILGVGQFTDTAGIIEFKKFLATKRGMNDNSIRKRLNSLKSFLKWLSKSKMFEFDESIFELKGDPYDTFNAVYKQYQQTEHFDTTLLSC